MGLVFPVIGSLANIRDFISAVHQSSRHFLHGGPLEPSGTGPYAPASYLTHPSLPGHTIFAPDPRALGEEEEGEGEEGEGERRSRRLPVLVWANGLGLAWGLMFGAFLREIASHGYIVVASGPPCDGGGRWRRLRRADAQAMVDAVRWAAACCRAGEPQDRGDVRARVDGSRIALAGQSRGGMDAYAAAAALRYDGAVEGEGEGARARARVRTVGLFGGGLFSRGEARAAQVRGLTVPVLYAAGGAADVGRRAAERDWEELLPRDLPAWMGTLDGVGHAGTFRDDERGGRFADVALDWLGATLRGDEGARRRLLEGHHEREGWAVRARNW